ncbi:MAG: anthrone oxygenase family protein [Blastocatellia bacterium]
MQILTVMVVAVAFALSLAHALELPGKMRLDKETYYAVQPIYYPGFTIGGISEPVGVLLTLMLLLLTPSGSAAFWLTLVALLCLLAQQAVYWLVTHPVNQFWLEGQNLSRAGASFFSVGNKAADHTPRPDWQQLRDRWEYSHVARAVLMFVSITALVIALAES